MEAARPKRKAASYADSFFFSFFDSVYDFERLYRVETEASCPANRAHQPITSRFQRLR